MAEDQSVQTGGCLCGAVRFEVSTAVELSCLCHCPSCRKAAGAPLVGWAMFDLSGFNCDRSNVAQFASSEGARRSFCSTCGTTLFYEADYLPGLIDITIESFDTPEKVPPSMEIWTKHETDCVRSLGRLQRFEELPPH